MGHFNDASLKRANNFLIQSNSLERTVRAKYYMSDEDPHKIAAAKLFGVELKDVTPQMRARAKIATYGRLYGHKSDSVMRDLCRIEGVVNA